MSYTLQANNFNNGQGYVVMPLLATLISFATLTPPVTAADMRAFLEVDQIQAFEDDDWNNLVGQLASVDLDTSLLTNDERAVYNTLREVASPAPSTRCCGVVIPSSGDGLTSGALYPRASGTAPYQTIVELIIDKSYTCDIAQIEVTLGVIGLAPAPVSPTITMDFVKCTDAGKAIYQSMWTTFVADPSGFDYNYEFNYKDANGASIVVPFPAVYNVTYP